MPRAKPWREPCDCRDCVDPSLLPAPTSAQVAIARQEPPPKSLIVYLHNALTGADSSYCPHVTRLVRDGCSGLLGFEAAGTHATEVVADLLGLDDATQDAPTLGQRFKELQAAAITDCPAVGELCRAAGASSVEVVRSAGQGSGMGWPEPAKLAKRITERLGIPFFGLPAASQPVPALAALAGPLRGDISVTQHPPGNTGGAEAEDDIDMLLLLLDASQLPLGALDAATSAQQAHRGKSGAGLQQAAAASDACEQQLQLSLPQQQPCAQPDAPAHVAPQKAAAAGQQPASVMGADVAAQHETSAAMEWLDSLLRHLNSVDGFRDTVLLTLVLGVQRGAAGAITAGLQQHGQQLLGLQQQQLQPGVAAREGQATDHDSPRPPFRRPLQSYQFRGVEQVAINPELAAVVVHRLPGVIRRDAVERLDVGEVQRRGGSGCILGQRLLAEVAYKLGRAPKYGA